jgi:hypothetical protein
VISTSQRPLDNNTQHSQETDIQNSGGIRTQNLTPKTAQPLGSGRELYIFNSVTPRAAYGTGRVGSGDVQVPLSAGYCKK